MRPSISPRPRPCRCGPTARLPQGDQAGAWRWRTHEEGAGDPGEDQAADDKEGQGSTTWTGQKQGAGSKGEHMKRKLKPKKAGGSLDMYTFTGKSGRQYLVLRDRN